MDVCYRVWLDLSSRDINPGPHTLVASPSPTEPSAQPLFLPSVPSLPFLFVRPGNGTLDLRDMPINPSSDSLVYSALSQTLQRCEQIHF